MVETLAAQLLIGSSAWPSWNGARFDYASQYEMSIFLDMPGRAADAVEYLITSWMATVAFT